MRHLAERYRRTLPVREHNVFEIEKTLDEQLKAEFGEDARLKALVYDDRQRFMEEQRRQVQQQAAGLAQAHLEVAYELMRLAGNGVWNSPVGFDRVLVDGMTAIRAETHTIIRRQDELAAHADDYQRLLGEGVSDNIARRR